MAVRSLEQYSEIHGPALVDLMRFTETRVAIEIGVAHGTTTYYLCQGADMVYGFDVWTRHGLKKQFNPIGSESQVTEYLTSKGAHNFKLHQMDSTTSGFDKLLDAIGPIDFALIDGCHSYLGVKNDFDKVYPRLSPRGMIVFHDSHAIEGVRTLCIELRMANSREYDMMDFPYGNGSRRVGITILKKRQMPEKLIDEICGGPLTPEEIYALEKKYYDI